MGEHLAKLLGEDYAQEYSWNDIEEVAENALADLAAMRSGAPPQPTDETDDV